MKPGTDIATKTCEFRRELDRLDAEVAHLRQSAQHSPGGGDLAEAVEELSATVEELHVAEEQLRAQNESLLEAQSALEAQRRRYQDLFDFAAEGLLVTDMFGTIRETNRAAAALLGVSSKHLVGKPLSVFIAEPDRLGFYGLLRWLQRTDRILRWELEVQPRSGEALPVELGIAAMQESSTRGEARPILRWSVRDVRERKATERARRLYETMIAASHDLMSFVDRNYVYRAVNERYTEVFGLAREEIVGRTVADVLGTEVFEGMVRPKIDECLSGRSVHYEHWLEPPGSPPRCFDVRYDPYFATDGRVEGLLVDARDVTERKRLAEDAARRQAELAHAGRLATIGELASSVTHELKQPLTAIGAYARACSRLQASGDSEKLAQALAEIDEQARRAVRITERLRRFGRREPVRREPVDLNRGVEEVLGLVRHDLERHQVTVRCEPNETLPPVPADKLQVQQVLVNLIRNAVDAMEADEPQQRLIVIRTTPEDDGCVEISVSDTGAGLPEEDPERLMESFFTTKPDGTGLGLSISRGIIEAHGGRLWATRNARRGATFHFTLPTQPEDQEPGAPAQSRRRDRGAAPVD
ncbi:MAG: PAS domain S-box protein [Gammaproteobacteria bacterium]|nr:PAS domain S-box protein [Gammaproteobacteria bacterium]NIR84012.1 PAS domain S-box protein [Gammaproteobacteria bacterium]NIR89156.1 PAS domain S-box protein [Gammaproteobacteria bacterium]NIU04958.1 PAS domain S-box protein [Gammaproteobacteria bacterium]NIV52124.1 PAS domain S-box protein [Gammaproteobacteria bacterium]